MGLFDDIANSIGDDVKSVQSKISDAGASVQQTVGQVFTEEGKIATSITQNIPVIGKELGKQSNFWSVTGQILSGKNPVTEKTFTDAAARYTAKPSSRPQYSPRPQVGFLQELLMILGF